MKTFVTADIHFNHVSCIKYCPDRWIDNRGFPEPDSIDVQTMNEKIIENWNKVVGVFDRVYILGDVAMGKIAEAPKCVSRLNGIKHLILGNHDKTIVKLPEFSDLFASSQDYLEFTYRKEGIKQPIVMSHFPFHSWNGQHHGTIMLHGHLHSPPDKLMIDPERRRMDVGLDGHNLTPWNLDEVVEMMRKIPVSKNHHDR